MDVVIHYDEIGLKGGNRKHFEQLLINNAKKKLGKSFIKYVKQTGSIVFEVSKDVTDVLSKVPGIVYFSYATKCDRDISAIKKTVLKVIAKEEFDSFRIKTKRSDKNFSMSSMDVDKEVGQAVVDKFDKKVKMKGADLEIKIEISNENVYVSTKDIKGVGGLPVNDKQKVVALLSGGFDSPVAAYLMMKRGCSVVMVHFQNANQMAGKVKDKVTQLAKQLSKFQNSTTLYIVPFEKLQKQLIMKVKAEQRMLVYRRFMIKIASEIAKKEKAKFLVVGDSLSQVASQTLNNLEATYSGSEKHIFAPLIGLDKVEIMDIARRIGTHDISILPYGDCCSYFLPKHPELKASAIDLRKIEETMDVPALVEDAVKAAKIYK